MRLAGQAGAVHPVFVDGAQGCGQDAGHAAGHQVALQSEMVPCVDVSSMIGIPIHSCGSEKSTVHFDAMSKRPDRAAIKREWIQRAITAPLREHIRTDG